MATTFYLRNQQSSLGTGTLLLTQRRGRQGATPFISTTVTAGGTTAQVGSPFFTEPVTSSVNITTLIALINIRGLESVNAVNAKYQILVQRYQTVGGILHTILAQSDISATELGLTETARTRTDANITSSVLDVGDRIKVTLFVAPTTTFGAGTVSTYMDGQASDASGDSFIRFNQDFTTSDFVEVSPYEIRGRNAYYG